MTQRHALLDQLADLKLSAAPSVRHRRSLGEPAVSESARLLDSPS